MKNLSMSIIGVIVGALITSIYFTKCAGESDGDLKNIQIMTNPIDSLLGANMIDTFRVSNTVLLDSKHYKEKKYREKGKEKERDSFMVANLADLQLLCRSIADAKDSSGNPLNIKDVTIQIGQHCQESSMLYNNIHNPGPDSIQNVRGYLTPIFSVYKDNKLVRIRNPKTYLPSFNFDPEKWNKDLKYRLENSAYYFDLMAICPPDCH